MLAPEEREQLRRKQRLITVLAVIVAVLLAGWLIHSCVSRGGPGSGGINSGCVTCGWPGVR